METSIAVCLLLRAADVAGRALRCCELQFLFAHGLLGLSSIAAVTAAAVCEDKL